MTNVWYVLGLSWGDQCLARNLLGLGWIDISIWSLLLSLIVGPVWPFLPGRTIVVINQRTIQLISPRPSSITAQEERGKERRWKRRGGGGGVGEEERGAGRCVCICRVESYIRYLPVHLARAAVAGCPAGPQLSWAQIWILATTRASSAILSWKV